MLTGEDDCKNTIPAFINKSEGVTGAKFRQSPIRLHVPISRLESETSA
jgi:hypothetical protein